jgi:integrase/recombinase XerD
MMNKANPKKYEFLKEYPDRHGKMRCYFRRRGFANITIKAERGTPEFDAEYEAALVKTAAAAPIGSARTKGGTLDEIIAAYLDVSPDASSPFKTLSPETQRTRRNILERWRKAHGKDDLYEVVRGQKVMLLTKEFMQRQVNTRNDRPFAQRNFINTAHAMFKWAVSEGRLPMNPCVDMDRIHKTSTGHKTWTADHVARFIKAHPPGTTAYLAMTLMLYTGARISDVYRFGPNNISNGVFAFDQRKVQGRETERVELPMHSKLAEAIKRTPTVGLRTFLVTSFGKPFQSGKAFGNKVREWCDKAGCPDVSAHGLRKAIATNLANAGASEHEIMAVTGHASPSEVARYTRAANRRGNARAAMALLEQG